MNFKLNLYYDKILSRNIIFMISISLYTKEVLIMKLIIILGIANIYIRCKLSTGV